MQSSVASKVLLGCTKTRRAKLKSGRGCVCVGENLQAWQEESHVKMLDGHPAVSQSSMLVRGIKISHLKGLILQRLWGSDLLLKLGGENQKEQKFHAVTFLFLCVIFTQNHHAFTKLSFFKCIIWVQLEQSEWLRVLSLLVVDLLLHRKFKNGKFLLSILLDAMSLPSMRALAEAVQLCLVFSWWRPATELCSGLFFFWEWFTQPLKKAWLHCRELEGWEEPAIAPYVRSSFLHCADLVWFMTQRNTCRWDGVARSALE